MLKKIFLLFLISFALASCKKSTVTSACGYVDSGTTTPATEVAYLQTWITANHPNAIKDTSGFFYEMTATGTGAKPTICSHVYIKYSGYLINSNPPYFKFDENLNGTTMALGSLIVGWQKGLELVNAGGSINLYIPPTLAYGATGAGIIPANSYLMFIVQVIDVL